MTNYTKEEVRRAIRRVQENADELALYDEDSTSIRVGAGSVIKYLPNKDQ